MKLLKLLPRFRRADTELAVLAAREEWRRDEIESLQLQRINELWRGAIRDVPYYRDQHLRLGLPDRFASIPDFTGSVSLLDKQTVVAQVGALTSTVTAAGAWHRTSGSTGVPTRVFRSHADHHRMLCAKYRFYASRGIGVFDPVAWLWSDTGATVSTGKPSVRRLRSRVEDRLRNRLRLPAARLGPDDLRSHLARMQAFRPAGIYGFSRAVSVLAERALADRVAFDSLRCVILTGEAASAGMRKTIEEAFGARTAMEYGSVECGFIAGESPSGEMRVRDDHVLLETLPRDDGHFDVVVTCFNNTSFPLIRYRIGDVTASAIDRPERGFSILRDLAGRNDDMLTAASGRLVHAACVDEIFESQCASQVSRYVIHQYDDRSVVAKVVLSILTSPAQSARLRKRVENSLASLLEGVPVTCELVEQIRQTAAGKHRLITSDIMRPRGMTEVSVGAVPCVS